MNIMGFLTVLSGYILGILFFMVLSIVFHEIGHFLKAERYKLEPEWKFTKKPLKLAIVTNGEETWKQAMKITEAGILIGFIIVAISFLVLGWFGLWVLAGYLWGIKHDVKAWFSLRRVLKSTYN